MFAILGGILLKTLSNLLKQEWFNLKVEIANSFNSAINNFLFQAIFFILLGILISYISYKFYKRRQRIKEEKREKERLIKEKNVYVCKFLNTDLRNFKYEELKEKLEELDKKNLVEDYPKLKLKIKEAENFLIELKHERRLGELSNEKDSIQDEIKQLEYEKKELEREKHSKVCDIKESLDLDENPVFDKSQLNEKEIEVLLDEGYTHVNEYCVAKRKIIPVLVKPPLNHSVAHAFLVWSTKQLLEEFYEIEDIKEHETRDADITFKLKRRYYAIEVETGSLLRKKKQLHEKIKFLKRKYKDRWMIIATHRNLVQKYKDFGICVQRKDVHEKLEKWLKK